MSQNKFFSIGNSIFNKDEIISITQEQREVRITQMVAVVTHKTGNEIKEMVILLPENTDLTEILTARNLNN